MLWRYGKTGNGILFTSGAYDLNRPVIALAKFHPGPVIVWSSGGSAYAAEWARRSGIRHDMAIAKDPRLPRPGDLCIDDEPLKVACRVLSPHEDLPVGR